MYHVDKITGGDETHFYFTVHCVIFKQAEEKLLAKGQDKEYAPIHGLPDFTVPSAKLAFGEDSDVIKNSLVCVFKICETLNFHTTLFISLIALYIILYYNYLSL